MTPPRPFACPVHGCGASFQNAAGLAGHHQRNHPPEANMAWFGLPADRNADRALACALYARVSTDDQNADQQFARMREEARRRGYLVVWEGKDEGSTGDSELWNRPVGMALWNLLKTGNVKVLISYDSSRLSSQTPLSFLELLYKLEHKLSVQYVSCMEPFFDTTGQGDEEMVALRDVLVFLVGWANNLRLIRLRKYVRRGQEAAKRKGRPIGSHPRLCGIPKDRGGAGSCPTMAHDTDGRSLRPKKHKATPHQAPPPLGTMAPEQIPPSSSRGL